MALDLLDDVAEVSGLPAPTRGVDDTVTVLMPTSPIPSHPSLDIISETVASVRDRLPGAEIVTSFKRLSDAMETANKTLSVSQVRMLKAAIAIGAVGAAGTAAVVGVAALGAAVIANSAAADDWNHDLEALGLNLDKVGTEQVNRAAAAIDAMGAVTKGFGVAIANAVGPEVELLGTRMVALGLASIDSFNNMAKGEGIMLRLADIASGVLTEALTSPLTLFSLFPRIFGTLADKIGLTNDVAEETSRILEGLQDRVQARLTPAIVAYVKEGMEPLIAATDDYMGRAGELVGTQTALNQKARDGATAVEEVTVAVTEAAAAWELYRLKAVGANEEVLKSTDKTAKGTAALSDYAARSQKEDVKAVRDATIQALEEEGAVRAQQVAFGLSVATQAADATLALVQMVAGESSKAALAAFLIQKAAALASIGVATAEKIRTAMQSREFAEGDTKLKLTCSIGVAGFPGTGERTRRRHNGPRCPPCRRTRLARRRCA
jgi:hypothetical protein